MLDDKIIEYFKRYADLYLKNIDSELAVEILAQFYISIRFNDIKDFINEIIFSIKKAIRDFGFPSEKMENIVSSSFTMLIKVKDYCDEIKENFYELVDKESSFREIGEIDIAEELRLAKEIYERSVNDLDRILTYIECQIWD